MGKKPKIGDVKKMGKYLYTYVGKKKTPTGWLNNEFLHPIMLRKGK